MSEMILITLAKDFFRILKNEVGNKKGRKGGCTPPINPSPMNAFIRRCENLKMPP